MRTKALLLGAAIGAISLASAMAQVYSVNIVGYINVPIPTGYCLIANQLNNATGNAVEALFPAPPTAITIYKYNKVTKIYDIASWDTDFQMWDIPTPIDLSPGDGFFVYNGGTPWTQTFVGEVKTGETIITLQQGLQMLSCVVPQSGRLATDLNWQTSTAGDTIYKYNTTTKIYDIYSYDADFQMWDPEEPSLAVGDGFFAYRGAGGGTWTRTFNVGP